MVVKDRSGHPLEILRDLKQSGVDEVIVAYSSGKDSLAVLDLCVKHFKRVFPYFMYIVKDLEFQEGHLRYVESFYDLKILRVPDWRLGSVIRNGVARHTTVMSSKAPNVTWRELEHYVRVKSGGLHWIASGETVYESLQRRGMIVACGGICPVRGHFYPVGFWRRQDVHSYLSQQGVILPSEYRVMTDGRSFGGITPVQMHDIKNNFPEDYKKIKKLFPLADAQVARWEIIKARKDKEQAELEAVKEEQRQKKAAEKAAEKEKKKQERAAAKAAAKESSNEEGNQDE